MPQVIVEASDVMEDDGLMRQEFMVGNGPSYKDMVMYTGENVVTDGSGWNHSPEDII